MEYPIGIAKTKFSQLAREAHQEPVIITRHGQPDVVLLTYADFEQLRRLRAYQQTLQIATKLSDSGLTVGELYEASRQELEERA